MIQDRTPLIPEDPLMGIISAFFFHFQRNTSQTLVGTLLCCVSPPRGIPGYSHRAFSNQKTIQSAVLGLANSLAAYCRYRGPIPTKHRISSHKVSKHILWPVTQSNPTGARNSQAQQPHSYDQRAKSCESAAPYFSLLSPLVK